MKIKLIFLFPAFLVLLFSCGENNKQDNFSISGVLKNDAGAKIVLSELGVRSITPVDSVTIPENGEFKFTVPVKERSFFILSSGNYKVVIAPEKGETVKISGDFSVPGSIVVSGSEDSEILHDFFKRSEKNISIADSLKEVLHQHENMDDLMKVSMSADSVFSIILENQKKTEKEILDSHPSSFSSFLILNFALGSQQVMNPVQDSAFFRRTDSLLFPVYQKNQHAEYLHMRLEELKNVH